MLNDIIVLIGGSIFTFQLIQGYFHRGPEERGPIVGERLVKAASDSVALQDISMTLPRQIGASPYRFIQLRSKDLTTPKRIMKYSELGPPPGMRIEPDYSYEYNALEGSATINIVFIKADGSDAHLLLDKKGFIATADIPNERDTSQRFNIYRLVFEDTDNDGRLTSSDRFDLYVSDLFGRNLRRITDAKIKVIRYLKSIHENKVLLLARVRPADPKLAEADWLEEIFVYDLKENQLSPFFSSDSLLTKVREMLWTK
jgi:hypothetical protein